MKNIKTYSINMSDLVEVENLLNGIDLNRYKLPVQIRQAIIKARHLLKSEMTNLFLIDALSIFNPSNSSGNSINKSVVMGGNKCLKS